MRKVGEKRRIRIIPVFFLFIALIIITGFIMLKAGVFHVKHIEVIGNKQFSNVEISNHILSDKYCRYAPYLFVKYKFFKPEEMPFVADIDVKLTGINKVEVYVKEKPIVAYAEHMNSNLFFDCDGIIVESSDRKIPGIIKVEGLHFKGYKLYEKPVLDNPIVLDSLNGIIRTIEKYDLHPEVMEFNKRGELNLHFEKLQVKLGLIDVLDEKMSRVASILPKLHEKKGVLKLNAYRKAGDSIVYIENSVKQQG